MVSFFLFLAVLFLLTFIVGILIEKIRIPWIFAALFLGAILAIHNPFKSITSSDSFVFMGNLGMYLLLFLIGLELNTKKIVKHKGFIFKAMVFIILTEAFFGTFLVHFLFKTDWLLSVLVALSFATVGEAILIPILDDLRVTNTKLGQTIIGIGTLDDIFEVMTLAAVVFLAGYSYAGHVSLKSIGFSLLLFAMLFIGAIEIKKTRKFRYMDIDVLFFLAVSLLFLFLAVGGYGDLTALGSLLAGITIQKMFGPKLTENVLNNVRVVTYGLFAPIFFLWVGVSIDMKYLFASPLVVLAIVVVSKASKLTASYIVGRKELGTKKSILLGIGLSVRFSTSIILIKILYDSHLIGAPLYSAIVASSIVFKFIVPPLFSNLLVRWNIARDGKGSKR